MEEKKSLYADLSLLLVAIIWGSGFVVTKNSLNHITPYYLLAYRFIISFLLMALVQNVAQKYTSSTHATIILSLESVFGGLLALIFLKEPFTIRFLIGCLAILISIITTETKWEFLREDRKSL